MGKITKIIFFVSCVFLVNFLLPCKVQEKEVLRKESFSIIERKPRDLSIRILRGNELSEQKVQSWN